MLPGQKWRADAIVRLLVSIFICIYLGSIAAAMHYNFTGERAKSPFLWVAAGGIVALLAALFLVRLPLERENILRRAGAALTCFYIGLVLAAWAQKLSASPKTSVAWMVTSALCFQGATVVLVFIFLREHRAGPASSFGLATQPWRAIGWGVVLGIAFLPVGWMLQLLAAEIMQHLPGLPIKPVEQQSVQTLRNASSVSHKIVLGITTILLAPLAEELLFRGVLYKWIRDLGFPRAALFGLSIVFATVHFNTVTFLPLVLLSVALTVAYERTGNLLAPIAAHASFNATNFALLYMTQRPLGP